MNPDILIVDDDAIFRTRLAAAISRRGHAVVHSPGPDEARAAVTAHPSLDAFIVDLRMPGASGLELVRWLRSRIPSAKILVLTGFGSIATAVEAIKLGAVEYLTKPADADQILSALFDSGPRSPKEPPAPAHFPSLDRVEWEHLQRVLSECRGNISMTARKLCIERRTLQRKLSKLPPPR